MLFSMTSFSQTSQFDKKDSGLIYPDSTIKQLKYIVDSLQLKFKSCDLSKIYYSKFQAKAYSVMLEKEMADYAKRDIDNNISIEDFITKYPASIVHKDLLVIRNIIKDKKGIDNVQFINASSTDYRKFTITKSDSLKTELKPLKNKWVYEYDSKYKSLKAYYFVDEFKQTEIPLEYAKMIQYSECMIDTTTQIFFKNARSEDNVDISTLEKYSMPELDKFIKYVNTAIDSDKPDFRKFTMNTYSKYEANTVLWESKKVARVDSIRKIDTILFDRLFEKALEEVKLKGGVFHGYINDFEKYVATFISPKLALELKRNRLVFGHCSQDSGPQNHAFSIAKLAASTLNWDIFLRAHLDIMNDKFDRVADSNIGQKKRNTYIKELEVLEIDVENLLVGIALRFDNSSQNHYFGNISRLGRAISESTNSNNFENKIIKIITDNNVDDYNRLLMYFLLLNRNQYLKENKISNEKLKAIQQTLPSYLAKINFEK